MAHSLHHEVRLHAPWRDLVANMEALPADLRMVPPAACRRALAAVTRAPREPPGLRRLHPDARPR